METRKYYTLTNKELQELCNCTNLPTIYNNNAFSLSELRVRVIHPHIDNTIKNHEIRRRTTIFYCFLDLILVIENTTCVHITV